MSLRQARINDYWRRVFKRQSDVFIKRITLNGNHIFSDFNAEFKNGIVCIVGKNGIGKSNFIRTVYNAFYTESSNRKCFSIPIINEGEIEIQLQNKQNVIKYTTDIGKSIKQGDYEITSFIFDPCNTIPSLQELMSSQDNFEELLESYNTVKLSDESIKTINYLANSNYKNIELTIIEDEFDSFSSLPFFKVTNDSVTYDVRTMGLGELSIFYFYWLIDHIREFEGNKVFLIEEPESFLPPSAQVKLTDILAKFVSETGVHCIVSSHSEHVLKRIPRDNVLIFKKEQNKIVGRNANDKFEFLKVIGLSAPKLGILIFEDSAAILFFKALIRNSKEFVTDSFYYHISGSDGDIINDLKRFPSVLESFKMVAMFDGDCRGNNLGLPVTVKNYTFLPSELSPEELLIKFIGNVPIENIGSILNKSLIEINDAIGETHGCDHHDYFEILAHNLEMDYNSIVSTIFDLWIKTDDNIKIAEVFVSEFRGLIE